jgi:uridine monophosphate synthetase
MNFFAWLEARARTADSLLCVGLDPRGDTATALRDESLRLIASTVDLAAIYKPNIAFFEAFGAEGLIALHEVIAAVPPEIPVLLDAKRGDIADTSAAYATAAFARLGAHAITASPYLGGEALTPLLQNPARGVFVLCKTSNPGADELQALPVALAGEPAIPLYEAVARRAMGWTPHGNVGLVAGATDPAALARIRAAAPDLWILAPGVGAQGGALEATVAAGLRRDGLGLLINVSRGLAHSVDPHREAQRLRSAINEARTRALQAGQSTTATPEFSALARDLVSSGCVRFGQFKLKSGVVSPLYMDLRRLVTYPAILKRVAQAYAAKLQELSFDRLAGIPYAALPIATAVALEMERPLVYPRREAKEYGTRATVEGEYNPGETIAVIDDVTTTGGSKLEAIEKLEAVGLVVRDVIVLIDRMQGAGEMLAGAGYRLHTILTLPALLDEWLRQGAISAAQQAEVQSFLQAPTG